MEWFYSLYFVLGTCCAPRETMKMNEVGKAIIPSTDKFYGCQKFFKILSLDTPRETRIEVTSCNMNITMSMSNMQRKILVLGFFLANFQGCPQISICPCCLMKLYELILINRYHQPQLHRKSSTESILTTLKLTPVYFTFLAARSKWGMASSFSFFGINSYASNFF